ncbi:DUF6232 family protein [Kineosporia sp. NBRC 101731]|uniref:DUF6232 family protein n=1 Tax=Kineosporia sp. NBRC 101731 TaxID=3032199 RepID=UPI0024A05C41|nr:DUF6232 family protein [Kineosporia sp. NBRC 101731]GLY26832.1 hypothetical protein Kisp02_01970 [Kineosporia sp. NBRC 101731]
MGIDVTINQRTLLVGGKTFALQHIIGTSGISSRLPRKRVREGPTDKSRRWRKIHKYASLASVALLVLGIVFSPHDGSDEANVGTVMASLGFLGLWVFPFAYLGCRNGLLVRKKIFYFTIQPSGLESLTISSMDEKDLGDLKKALDGALGSPPDRAMEFTVENVVFGDQFNFHGPGGVGQVNLK